VYFVWILGNSSDFFPIQNQGVGSYDRERACNNHVMTQLNGCIFYYHKICCLFTGVGLPPGGSGPYTCTQKAKNSNILEEKQYKSQYTKIENRTCKTMKQKQR
jgi:hypothetical protein